MPKGTTAHEQTTAGGTEQWFSIALRPAHGALFRAWAQRLGWSDADLAAHIFRLGTITLALAHLGPHGPTDDPRPPRRAHRRPGGADWACPARSRVRALG